MRRRVLTEHFDRTRQQLLEHMQQTNLAEHGDVKGAAREGIIRLFLQRNLPSLVEFKTGEILGRNDERSGQIDIVLQSSASPRIPIFDDVQITLVDAALGALEVKSTLTTASWGTSSHLRAALDTFRKVKALERGTKSHIVSPTRPPLTLSRTPCFLIAYRGPTVETLLEALLDYGQYFECAIDDYAPEVVCILDRSYSVVRDDGWLVPRGCEPAQTEYPGYLSWSRFNGECLATVLLYICRVLASAALDPVDFLPYTATLDSMTNIASD